MDVARRLRHLLLTLAALASLALAPGAQAIGGSYRFDGGTAYQRAQVRQALAASRFNYGVVSRTITVHIRRGVESNASAGEVWLDADLLDSGRFSWGVVQHEFAHQIDFLVFTPGQRAEFSKALGGRDWCFEQPNLRHSDHGCERFASTLAWTYWQSPDNSMRPTSVGDESAAMTPTAFRALVDRVLGPAFSTRMLAYRR